MAYTPATMTLVSQTLEGTAGTKRWVYVTADSVATVTGASYVTDALNKKLVKGDMVDVVNVTTPSTNRMQVISVSGANATLGDTGEVLGAAATSTIGFYGTTPIAQRTSAVQTTISTSAPVAISSGFGFATSAQMISLLAAVAEIQATLTLLGLWKGS